MQKQILVDFEVEDGGGWKGEYGGICTASNVLFLILSGESTDMFPLC